MKKILITGGAGFIGSNFARYACEKYPAYEIVVLDKLTYAGNKENIADLINSEKIKFIKGDIADKKLIFGLFKKERFALVVNFAAETHVDRSIVNPDVFVMTNIVGTQNLLAACREFPVCKFLQISTDEVYGDLDYDSLGFFTEKTPLNPTSPYAASKAASDLLALAYYKTYKMPVIISRCSNNYGPYQFPEKLIPYFFQLASQNKFLPVYGDGKNIRDWLFVLDHCEALDLILQHGKPGEIYNIGGHNEKCNIEIAKMILKFLGKPQSLIAFVEDRPAHDRRYAIDAAKIEKELGWKPKTTFEKGIELTFEWYEKHQIDETRRHLSIPPRRDKSKIKTQKSKIQIK
ncbi:dTDP-glucose 4,6-dehydratase [Candidatus Peregrinibacteria bacterium]|nr:dTDP-glucose 4,6-dehydratase [Candidatus Peregrinibacteria bacterium]